MAVLACLLFVPALQVMGAVQESGSNPGASAAPPVARGVSQQLARWRARHYRDVTYDMQLEIEPGAPLLRGRVVILVTLPRKPLDLILDWRPGTIPPNSQGDMRPHVGTMTINGTPWPDSGPVPLRNEHIVVPAQRLRPGANRFELEFATPVAASGTAITRFSDREDGQEYLYSLLVPADASSVFPCFDQPDIKARITLATTVPTGWQVIGNGAVVSEEAPRPGRRLLRFADTPPISTYLFAFAAGPFATIDDEQQSPRPVRLHVRQSRLHQARLHAAEVLRLNRESLAYLARYFDYPFPFQKYDLVLIPEFAYNGMEHAGATFLREDSVLFPSDPGALDHLRRAQLIFHENAHQWFGDLVTMRWFDDLWLKEGFANFMAAKATEKLMPDMPAWAYFHALKTGAYRTDATHGTAPIRQPLANLDAAKSAYGAIVYSKAPAVLRQAEYFFGEQAFNAAVRSFIRRHAWAAANWRDLVREFERATSGNPAAPRRLTAWADAWVRRRGIANIDVTWTSGKDGALKALRISQQDALAEGGLWPMRIQLALIHSDGSMDTKSVLLQRRTMTIHPDSAWKSIAAPHMVYANLGDFGYGRFFLDEVSQSRFLSDPAMIRDPFLRQLMLEAVWESVREARLAPEAFVDLALKVIPMENNEVTIANLLTRIQATFQRYLTPVRRAAWAESVDRLLIAGLRAPDASKRILYLHALMDAAWSASGRAAIHQLLDGTLSVSGVTLHERDRLRLVRTLLLRKDPLAQSRLETETAAAKSGDGQRYAFAAAAARSDPEIKSRYFSRFLEDSALPESWIEESLLAFNAPEQANLTLPFLDQALDALPVLRNRRKIFFVNAWLGAFVGGQASRQALELVRRHANRPALPPDLRLKLLEAMDTLERTVRIRARFTD